MFYCDQLPYTPSRLRSRNLTFKCITIQFLSSYKIVEILHFKMLFEHYVASKPSIWLFKTDKQNKNSVHMFFAAFEE